MSWIDALYFSTETIATVGYGDFSFVDQPTWLRLFGIVLMFAGVTTTAVADGLRRRPAAVTPDRARNAGRRKVRELRDHVVVVGLGSFGIRVVGRPQGRRARRGGDRAQRDNRYLSAAAELDVPVIFGDATLRQTLESARIDDAIAVAVLTHDDMVNIETGIVLRELLGVRWMRSADHPGVPVVLRVYDRTLGAAVAHRFGFENVRSTVELGGAVVHRRRDGPAGARHVLGGPALVHGRRRSGASRAANSTGCAWSICPPRPGSSRSSRSGPADVRCTRAATPSLTAGDTAYLVGPVPGTAGDAAQGTARHVGGTLAGRGPYR